MLNSTQQEIFDFLKENLKIALNVTHYTEDHRIEVNLYLCDEKISTDTDYL